MKEVVLKLDYHDDKSKQEAMKIVFGLKGTRWLGGWGSDNGTPAKAITGIDSIAMDMKDKKLTMIGHIDTVAVVTKLSKVCHTEIVTVGPAKEPDKKKEEPKKEEPKKKVVLKLDFNDDKGKQEAAKKVSGLLNGIDSIAMDMKDKKLTMIGHIDTVAVVTKLSKVCHTEIVTVGPAKEPDKKKEPKKEEPNKEAVLKLDYHDDKRKQEAMKIVFGLNGVDSIEMDLKDKKLTIIGGIDPVAVVNKLRNGGCHTEIVTMTQPRDNKKERKQEAVKEPDTKKKDPKERGVQEGKKAGGDDKKKDVRRR